ncbi:MAG: acyltransferase [Rhodospirillales bacterium]|nr:acyltransferase [Rhodospirillales bacterium]
MGVVRLFLALVVAADHWRVFILIPAGSGIAMSDDFKLGFNAGYAVMFFYVISGFLITYTLSKNYQPGLVGAGGFYRKRFIRIFALYWPLVLVTFLAFPPAWSSFAAAGALQQFSSLFLISMDWQITAGIGNAGIFGLTQAWTLGAELTFYLSAPVLMRSWKIGVGLLLASLAFRLGFVIVHGPGLDPIWTYAFPGSTFCFFMAGHLICLASQRWRVLSSAWLAWPMLAASMAAMLWAGNFADFDGRRFWLSVIFFTLALPGVFASTMRIRWMNELGDLSYPVYLVHLLPIVAGAAPMVVEVAANFGSSPYTSTACFLVMVMVCALVARHMLERPVAHLMTRAFVGRPAATVQTVGP